MNPSFKDMKQRSLDRPTFFILGAPKCGTSTLYELLRKHPNIYLPETKVEPHFFATDIALHRRHADLDSYLSLFCGAPEGSQIGEASTWYLFSKRALENILDFEPNARMIALLRNPTDMAASMHAFNLIKRHETEADFEVAWGLQALRDAGNAIPPNVTDPCFVQYYQACALADQVELLMSRVPEEQRLILIYEDFFADPTSGFERVCEFLNVPHVPVTEVPRANAHRAWRYSWLADLLTHPPRPLTRLYGPAKRISNSVGLRPASALRKFNTTNAKRLPLAPDFRRKLDASFAENNDRLRVLLNHSLPGWSTAGDR